MKKVDSFSCPSQPTTQLELFVQLSQWMIAQGEPTVLYRATLAEIGRLIESEQLDLYLYRSLEPDELRLWQWRTEAGCLTVEGERHTAAELQERDPGVAHILHARPPLVHERVGLSAQLAAPLSVRGKLYGILSLRRHRDFRREEIQTLRHAIPLLSSLLENLDTVRLQQEERHHLISHFGHELRAPLNTINGYLELLLAGSAGPLQGEQVEFVQRARASSENLYAMIEDTLLLARLDNGRLQLYRSLLDVAEVVLDAVEQLELDAKDRSLQIQIAVPPTLPRLYADQLRLQQVVRNLVRNAIDNTEPGGKIWIRATPDERDASLLLLQVQDTGRGIEPRHRERIFERGYQIRRPEGHRHSQGMGLAAVRAIVEAHGGRVEVESETGKGSLFTCFFPGLLSA
ncbi:signal transduction histidine kinase [Thermosporothrix hazakensis]|jgi:signal transduction histidine kinase|uniref:histidine kinase n=1 Tax=Thermosporothrix hazakensis TaxID=644383 RepID=A0A326UG03_THEHA|nr:GAF domain-containing sensor histidine kinase [Thermosporothrix hazakensis]PZW36835.1 signal transduction histidine kinase [Thermosporothrix hazakensis]GCE47484.1 hypothetical protein KTH_23530 [Thermosporothrix hazakensis]